MKIQHYTNDIGFEGIISSNSLYATEYASLNDLAEFEIFPHILKDIYKKRALRFLRPKRNRKFVKKEIKLHGGIKKYAEHVAGSMSVKIHNNLKEKVDFFVTCFCQDDDEFNIKNGRLSQWKYYGRDGFMISFDLDKLTEIMSSFSQRCSYANIAIGGVSYLKSVEDVFEDDDRKEVILLNQYIEEHITKTFEMATEQLENPFFEMPDYVESEVFLAITSAQFGPFYKHHGFREENELRACYCIFKDREKYKSTFENCDEPYHECKEVFELGNNSKRTIRTFDDVDCKLPITHVVVSPGIGQPERVSFAKKLLKNNGYDVPVLCSEIPYVP